MHPCAGGSLKGRSRFSFQTRLIIRVIPCSPARQGPCHRLEPLKREFFRLAQIGPVELALSRIIGAPVCSPAPVTCTLFVRREIAVLTAKGEGRGGRKPVI